MLPSVGLCLHTAAARGRKTGGGGSEYLPRPPQISVEADTGHAPTSIPLLNEKDTEVRDSIMDQ